MPSPTRAKIQMNEELRVELATTQPIESSSAKMPPKRAAVLIPLWCRCMSVLTSWFGGLVPRPRGGPHRTQPSRSWGATESTTRVTLAATRTIRGPRARGAAEPGVSSGRATRMTSQRR